jgi:hypothetical protein
MTEEGATMSTSKTKAKARATKRKKRGSRRGGVNVGVVASLAVFTVAIFAIAFGMGSGGGEDPPPAGSQNVGQDGGTVAGLKATGEVSGMGVPVYEVPGAATGSASAGGVTVEGANWAMGQVPLDIAVRPYWTLTNTGAEAVTLGEPQAEVRAGCCPGPFAMDAKELAPGDSTRLTFELAMHEGMDGWHDMGVYVPVQGGGDDQVLALAVTGDFRN